MHAKYREERQKRLRTDGIHQYVEPAGKFDYLNDDPYTPLVEREPLNDHVEFLFVGGGFAGLSVCARLKEAGLTDFRIIEGGGDFGGVWYWNRYPGAMCDTAAMVYLPLLEETGHAPSMKYVQAPEIRGHAVRIANHYDLYPHAVFSTRVENITWDEAASRWIVETDRGDQITATHIAMGTGPLNKPKLPGIPGIETFAGDSFHTSRWNYDVTGGSPEGDPMTALADKRVGVIGTGATGIQIVPSLGRDSGELHVFQRTPSAVAERNNQPLDPEWIGGLGAGWQAKWLRNFAQLQSTGVAEEDLVHDGWTDITKRIVARLMSTGKNPAEFTPDDFIAAYEDTDDENMQSVRARVDEIIGDPSTAEGLKAWYRQFCKRPCFHDEYLPTFNRPNVHLVDTEGQGVERIDETGAWAGGNHYPLDVLVYASGFEFNTDYTHRSGFEVRGRNGLTLTEKWRDGMESFQGMHVHGFPNMFIVGFTQGSNLASNITSNYTEAGHTIAAILNHKAATGANQIEVTAEVERDWVAAIEAAPQGIVGGPDCTPGYYNSEGEAEGRRAKLNMGGYPLGPVPFFDYIAEWRANGKFDGLEFRTVPALQQASSV